MFTPAITASRVSPPDLMTSIAFAQARTPLALEITMFFGLVCALATRKTGNTAAPRIAARLLKLFAMRFSPSAMGSATAIQGNSARNGAVFAKEPHYGTRQAGGNTPLDRGKRPEQRRRGEAKSPCSFQLACTTGCIRVIRYGPFKITRCYVQASSWLHNSFA